MTRRRWIGLTLVATVFMAGPAFAFHDGVGPGSAPVVSAEMTQRLREAGEPLSFIDLRPAEEFKTGHLPGARSIPFWDVLKRYAEIPRTGRVILYCACSLNEVQPAYQFLWDHGYRNVAFLEDGFPGWVKRGYPVEQ